jgi:mRNA-degrading endonuclease RelE of RelBE toxin-antitoxin system
MSFEIIPTPPFAKELKALAKKYKSIGDDLRKLIKELDENPKLGTYLGKDCYKIRMTISSKGKGKSGGARVITYVKVVHEKIYLLDIYDKSNSESISDKELMLLIRLAAE